jgi:hypothetical protein
MAEVKEKYEADLKAAPANAKQLKEKHDAEISLWTSECEKILKEMEVSFEESVNSLLKSFDG